MEPSKESRIRRNYPAYSDHKFEAGKTYRYTVTAVKKNGQESKQPEPVEVVAP